MDKFEAQFTEMDVRAGVVENAMSGATASSMPEDQIDSLLRQVRCDSIWACTFSNTFLLYYVQLSPACISDSLSNRRLSRFLLHSSFTLHWSYILMLSFRLDIRLSSLVSEGHSL